MAHLRVYKQQEANPVQFSWRGLTIDTIPLVGQFVGDLKPGDLSTHRPLVAFTPNGLRQAFWVLAVLWNSFNRSEAMILLGSVQHASEFRFGVVLQDADEYIYIYIYISPGRLVSRSYTTTTRLKA